MTTGLRHLSIPACVIALLSLPLAQPVFAEPDPNWTQFRGSSAEGPALGGDLPDKSFGLRVEWTRDLGSGYSNIWTTEESAVTMYNAGEIDVVAAFNPADGKELWRYELGERYAGHDGSDTGPIGTPTVNGDVVYALGPRGQLVALSLADGAVKWRRELNEENSTIPFYGYTTSPIVTGKLVIIATGGEGHAVTAFDRKTGEPKWTAGDDTISYQTPMLVTLGGRAQLLTVTNKYLQGLDPDNGKILWQLQHTEGNQGEESAHPTMLDGERFLIKYARGARLYQHAGDGVVAELWRTRAFGNGFALPVLVGDHLYGFSGSVMTCVAAETGEIAWRSRELNGLGLAEVDGKLAIVSRQGELVLVDASPEGYREVARTSVFENGDYAIPTFHDGRFLVRNLAQLASVRIDSSMAPQVAALDDADRLLGDFGAWVATIEALPEPKRQTAVAERFDSVETTPLVDADGLLHLVWRGDAQDVGVSGDFFDGGQEVGLYHVEGSDLFYRSVQADPKAQYTYNFIVDFGDPQTDPNNSLTVDNGFGVASEVRMTEWPASPFLDEPAEDAPRGTLDSFLFRSTILDNSREIQVWRPADYGQDPEQRYPLLVVNHGDNMLRGGLMENALNNLVGDSVAPIIAVFVPRASSPEYGGASSENYMRFLIEELLPHLDQHYMTDPTQRAIFGPASAGVAAVLASITHPDVFQKAAAESYYPIEPAHGELPDIIAAASDKPDLVYVVWSRHDYDLGEGRTAESASKELLGWLKDADVNAVEQVADYSPNWAGWRGQYDEILAALFPVEE